MIVLLMEINQKVRDSELITACREINKKLGISNRIEALMYEPLTEAEREYMLLYFEMYRNLTLLFGDDKVIINWLTSYNRSLNGYPLNLILSTSSLRIVNDFLALSSTRD